MNVTNPITTLKPAASLAFPAILRKPFLLACLFLVAFLPLGGSLLRWKGLPPGYGAFPPPRVAPPPGLDTRYLVVFSLVALGLCLYLGAPRLFGFKAPVRVAPAKAGPLPAWFAPGVAVMGVSWGLMWFGSGLLARFSFVPLWWGFIYALDGLVYARTNGRSIVGSRKHEMLILALVSVVGWYLFEYLNYFALGNWYYPHAHLLTPFGNVVWYTLSYTTIWPACFEWYMLLMTFPAIRRRWADGPKIALSRGLMAASLMTGLALLFLMGRFPYPMFWALWVGSLLVIMGGLKVAGFWTPFDAMAQGDWSRFSVMALATLLNGLCWEVWNYGSQAFRNGVPSNPNFWGYDVPYVNVIHLFSEMPLLGYFGYLCFGLLVWVVWVAIAHLVDLEPDFAHQEVMAAVQAATSSENLPAKAG